MTFKIIAVRLNPQTGLIEVQFRPTSRPSAKSGRVDFWKVYIPTMNPRPDPLPDGRPNRSALRRLVEAVYGPMPDEQAWELDLEQLIGQEVESKVISGRVGIDPTDIRRNGDPA
jgi:hypothetical protein